MKPHEQEWARSSVDWRVVEDASSGLVIADVRPSPSEGGKDVARLIAAAPDMARALLAVLRPGVGWPEERHTDACWDDEDDGAECIPSCLAVRAALRKAGVLP